MYELFFVGSFLNTFHLVRITTECLENVIVKRLIKKYYFSLFAIPATTFEEEHFVMFITNMIQMNQVQSLHLSFEEHVSDQKSNL